MMFAGLRKEMLGEQTELEYGEAESKGSAVSRCKKDKEERSEEKGGYM